MTPAVAEIRRSGIGSSEIAAVLGMSPWSEPFAVYASKIGELKYTPANSRMKWGTILQRAIAEGFTQETGLPHAWKDVVIRHPQREWQLASPDAIVTTSPEQVLEVKAVALDQAKNWGESGSQDIPDYYALQVQWQMSTLGLDHAWVAALIAGNDFRIYPITRDPEIEWVLLEEGEKFWREHVLARVPPPIGSSAAAEEFLRQKFPRNTEVLRKASDEELPMLQKYAEIRATYDFAEEQKKTLENRIKLAIGDADGIEGWCTWKRSKDTEGVNYEQMAIEYLMTVPPEERERIQEKYRGVVKEGSRRFLWKAK